MPDLGCRRLALLFVGECRSITAQRKGWTWKDGRLAAKPLFEALQAMGVDPKAHHYVNLWTDNAAGTTMGNMKPGILGTTVKLIMARAVQGFVVVALGKRVSSELARRGIVHVALVHPAARGAIRKRERYHAHVADTLGPHVKRDKVLRIQSAIDDPGASWIERYFLCDKRGAWREQKRIPGNGQYAPGENEILAWFRKLGVTHVEVMPGWHETVPPKVYTLTAFAGHVRRVAGLAQRSVSDADATEEI